MKNRNLSWPAHQLFFVFLFMVLDILKFPDPRLREKSSEVKEASKELEPFVKDMLETMYKERGIGLSAPQVCSPRAYRSH